MLVMGSYNVVDAVFVGRLGPEAIAALTVSFPLMMIFVAVGVGTGVGATSLISRLLGAGKREEANRVAAVSFSLVVLFGVLITAVCLPNLESLLRLFGAKAAVMPLAKSYMSILVTFAMFNFFPMIVGAIIRAEGNPILPSIAGVISVVANIALDPVLIFGIGPVPPMGIAGAATATVIARSISIAILLGYFVSKRTSYRFRPSYFIPRLRILFEIYRIGLSQIVQMTAESVTMGFANTIAGGFGIIPLALIGVIMRSASFILMPCVGLAQGSLPLIGYNYGANQRARIGEIIGKSGLIVFAWSVVFFTFAMIFPTQVVSIFNNEREFLLEGTSALRIFALAFPFIGIQMVVGSFFQGIGKGLPSVVLASARQVIFLLPGLLIFPRVFGVQGLWYSFPLASLLAIILSLVWASIQFRKLGIQLRFRSTQSS